MSGGGSDWKERGLFCPLLPRVYDGEEMAPACFVEVVEELARHDASTAWCVGQNGVCAMSAAYLSPGTAHRVGPAAR